MDVSSFEPLRWIHFFTYTLTDAFLKLDVAPEADPKARIGCKEFIWEVQGQLLGK